MNKRTLVPTTLAAAALLAGCVFNDGESEAMAKARFDVRASGDASLAKRASAPDTGLVFTDSTGLAFTVTEARAFLGKLKLIGGNDTCGDYPPSEAYDPDTGKGDDDGADTGDGDCGDGGNVLNGPFVIDLLTGASTPAMGEIEVPAGTYRKVKIHLDHAQKSDKLVADGDPLLEHTLYVKGTLLRPGSDSAEAFTLMLKFNEEVEIQSIAGMPLDASTLTTLLVSLKAGEWLAGMDVGACLAEPAVAASLADGVVISETTRLGECLDVEKTVKRNIRASFAVKTR